VTGTKRAKRKSRLPGDPTLPELVERMVRVDHAGEYGAVCIYEGQLAVLGGAKSKTAEAIRAMAETEKQHLDAFNAMIADRRVRPTALMPFWHVAGFALGAATALLGERAAMACTVAVEEVIDEHYARQVETLGGDEPALGRTFEKFRREEIEHRDTALAHGAQATPGYEPLTALIKAGSRLAIWLSERI
jgi:ubiquinone biosynthesis monooxygenase Coq7